MPVISADPVSSNLASEMQDDGRFLLDNSLYCGDARNLLQQVRPDSVDLSFWSPPYYVGKSYERSLSFQDWQHLLEQVILHHFPILKPGGFLVINIADILAFSDPSIPRIQADNVTSKKVRITKEEVLLARQANPHLNRYQLAKLLGCSEQTIDRRLKHNNVRGGKYAAQTRVLPVAGLVDGWASKAGFYLYDRRIWVKDPCWQNSRWHSLSYRSVDEFEYLYFYWKPGITTIDRSRLNSHEWSQWGSRGVWYIPSVRTHEEHEAQFPVELPRRVIRLLSRPSGLVLDCFVGSGTTAVAAIQEGRRYLGFDIVPQNIEQAACRCHQSQVPLSDARP